MLDVFKRELHVGDIVAYSLYNKFRWCLVKNTKVETNLRLIYPDFIYNPYPNQQWTAVKEVTVNPKHRDILLITPDLYQHIPPLQLDLLMRRREKLKL